MEDTTTLDEKLFCEAPTESTTSSDSLLDPLGGTSLTSGDSSSSVSKTSSKTSSKPTDGSPEGEGKSAAQEILELANSSGATLSFAATGAAAVTVDLLSKMRVPKGEIVALLIFISTTFPPGARDSIFSVVETVAKMGVNIGKIVKIIEVLGKVAAVTSAIINVINAAIEAVNIFDAGTDFGKNVMSAIGKGKTVWDAWWSTDKGDFVTEVGVHIIDRQKADERNRAEFTEKGWSYDNFTAAADVYQGSVSAAIQSLTPLFTAFAQFYRYGASAIMDIVGLVGGVIGGACSVAWTLLNWIVDTLVGWEKIFKGASQALVNMIDNYFVPNPFGRDLMAETAILTFAKF